MKQFFIHISGFFVSFVLKRNLKICKKYFIQGNALLYRNEVTYSNTPFSENPENDEL